MVGSERDVVVAVLLRADRFLVIRRGPGARMPGYWAPPSGVVEAGESQQDALVREVREEVGLTAVPSAKVWRSRSADGVSLLHWWTARAEDGEVVPDPREVAASRWVTAAEFLALDPVFPGDREFFVRVLPRLQEP